MMRRRTVHVMCGGGGGPGAGRYHSLCGYNRHRLSCASDTWHFHFNFHCHVAQYSSHVALPIPMQPKKIIMEEVMIYDNIDLNLYTISVMIRQHYLHHYLDCCHHLHGQSYCHTCYSILYDNPDQIEQH